MKPLRTPVIAARAASAALVIGAPAASASTAAAYPFPIPTALTSVHAMPVGAPPMPNYLAAGSCGGSTFARQGRTGGTTNQLCLGSGLSFVGPSIGQIATVIGPTIISPGFVGNAIVSAGNVAVGP